MCIALLEEIKRNHEGVPAPELFYGYYVYGNTTVFATSSPTGAVQSRRNARNVLDSLTEPQGGV